MGCIILVILLTVLAVVVTRLGGGSDGLNGTQTSYFPDCGYGKEARWVNDSNGDGMPGPSGDEFFCTLLPDCYTTPPFGPKADIIAQDMSQEQFRANILARVVLCEGDEPWPDFEDFFDNNPWADELLLTNSSMLNDFLDGVPFYRNAYWAKRLEELQGNSSTESTPTEEPGSEAQVDEEGRDITGEQL